jgi:ribonuclease HI
VRIAHEDGRVVDLKQPLGVCTNNVAEYKGLLAALTWAVDHDVHDLHVRSDSELLVKQMRGEYRVRSPVLQPLVDEARALVQRIGRVRFEHVRRERNDAADRLANEAMDEAQVGARSSA